MYWNGLSFPDNAVLVVLCGEGRIDFFFGWKKMDFILRICHIVFVILGFSIHPARNKTIDVHAFADGCHVRMLTQEIQFWTPYGIYKFIVNKPRVVQGQEDVEKLMKNRKIYNNNKQTNFFISVKISRAFHHLAVSYILELMSIIIIIYFCFNLNFFHQHCH